jgi:hypothetical protein
MTHKEPTALVIRVMACFSDPAIVGGKEIADLGDNADAVGTRNHQPKSAHEGETPKLY